MIPRFTLIFLALASLVHAGPASLKTRNVVFITVDGLRWQDVFRGAERLLRDVRPTVLCEIQDGNAAAIGDTLHQSGYRLFDLEHRPYRNLKRPAANTLCIPQEKLNDFHEYLDGAATQRHAA